MPTCMSFSRSRFHWLWLIWPALACYIGIQHMDEFMHLGVSFDAKHIYLPAAERFLREGWSFFKTPDSYRVVPLAYLWPALWQVDTEWIRWANCGLWIACVLFLWDSARQLGGERAGAIAMILWATNPEIYRYFPTELTEPVFVFGLLCWTWAMVRLFKAPGPGCIAAAAVGLAITLLSRPVLQLVAPLILVVALVVWLRARHQPLREPTAASARAIAISVALGLLLPLSLVIKNGLVFGLWGLGTGSGTGLYLGTHPLFQGTEPAFLGFDYDNNLIAHLTANETDHLSLGADRAARAIGIWQLQAMPLGDAVQFLSRKLWWWLAHHPVTIPMYGGTLRKLRLFELASVLLALIVMARVAWTGGRAAVLARLPQGTGSGAARMAAALFFFAMWGALLTQLLPILYNSRYSTGLLDPWLVMLAACSLAWLLAPLTASLGRHNWSLQTQGSSVLGVLSVPLILLLLTNSVYNYAKRHEVVRIDRPSESQRVFTLPADRITTQSLTPAGEHRWVTQDAVGVLSLDLSEQNLASLVQAHPDNAMWRLDLAIARPRGKCKPLEVAYQRADGHILESYPLVIPADGKTHASYIHGNRSLRPQEAGRLRLVFKCPAGTSITWSGTAFLASTHYLAAVQHAKTPIAP